MHKDLFKNIRLRVGALGQGTTHVAVTSRDPKEGPQKHWYPVCSQKNERSKKNMYIMYTYRFIQIYNVKSRSVRTRDYARCRDVTRTEGRAAETLVSSLQSEK